MHHRLAGHPRHAVHEVQHAGRRQPVEDLVAAALVPHQPRLAQHAEVLADGGHVGPHQPLQVLDAALATPQLLDHEQPRGLPQRLEHAGRGGELAGERGRAVAGGRRAGRGPGRVATSGGHDDRTSCQAIFCHLAKKSNRIPRTRTVAVPGPGRWTPVAQDPSRRSAAAPASDQDRRSPASDLRPAISGQQSPAGKLRPALDGRYRGGTPRCPSTALLCKTSPFNSMTFDSFACFLAR